MPAELDVAALVAPWSPEDFAATVWERRPVLLPARGAPSPFSLADLDALIALYPLSAPMIRLLGEGGAVPAAAYTHPTGRLGVGVFRDLVRPEAVVRQHRDGATLALESADRLSLPARRAALALTRWLAASATINAYLSPPGGRAFAPHWDTQGVFVLQVAGRKRWFVHEPARVLPLPMDVPPPGGVVPGALLLECVLEPGDVLFLPRGFVHHARALEESSLHLSLSVTPSTVATLLLELGAEVPDDPVARRALPPVFEPAVHALDAEARALLPADDARIAAAWDAVLDRLALRSPPAPVGWLSHLAAPCPLRPDDRVIALPQLVRVVDDTDGVRVLAPGTTLRFPPWASAAVRALLVPEGGALAGSLPGLSEEEALELTGHLLREGLVGRGEVEGGTAA